MILVTSVNILGVLIAFSFAAKVTFARSSNCGHSDFIASLFFNTIIKSPGYPSDYKDNLNCTWTIKVSFSGYIVKVLFRDFLLEDRYPCDDVLTFYDGMNETSNLLGSYCGTIHPEVIYSTGQYLYVKFVTDNMIKTKGFKFSFTAVKEVEASGICRLSNGSDKINRIRGFSGTIFTPDYPVPYPNDARCNWIITVPSGKRVKLKFEDLDFGPVSSSCKKRTNEKDYVQIGSGLVPGENALALYCGYAAVSALDVHSTGKHMWVQFYSISSNRFFSSKGFKAHFEALDIPPPSKEMCFLGNIYNNKLTLNGSFGTLQSPQDHTWHHSGLSCDWLITVPEGKIVKLTCDKVDLKQSSGSTCIADYVEVLDGSRSNDESKGKFCGNRKPGDIRSSGRYMWVRFRTDPHDSIYEGFNATYKAEDKSRLTSREVTIVSVLGSVFFIVVVAVAATLFKKHRAGRKPNIPDGSDEEEIQPYATVRLSLIFPQNDESKGPGNNDIPLVTLPFQLWTPREERAPGRTELGNSPYENTDNLGESCVTPVEYLFYQPRYENEAVNSESRNVVIRPGYDKLMPATTNLPCEYDALIRETDLRCKSRRGHITDKEGEDNMKILEVPSSDQGTPACSMDRKNRENSLGKMKSECIENVWKKETLV